MALAILLDTAICPAAQASVFGFTATGHMNSARFSFSASLLPGGKVLLAGGRDASCAVLSSAELFNPSIGTFSLLTHTMTSKRADQTAVFLDPSVVTGARAGQVLIIGGGDGINRLQSAERYVPSTASFAPTAGLMTTARDFPVATLLANGKVLITGGFNNTRGTLSSAELYDPATDTFSATGSMHTDRDGHTAILLASHKVLIAGGLSLALGSLGQAELYDPSTGTFSCVGGTNPAIGCNAVMLDERAGLPAAFFASGPLAGMVLLAGGIDGRTTIDSAELYSPTAAVPFAATGSMADARFRHTSTVLGNGQVLIAGGFAASTLNTAEIFDPTARTFACVGGSFGGICNSSMTASRDQHTATLLADGSVLIAGGTSNDACSGSLASAELFHLSAPTPTPTLAPSKTPTRTPSRTPTATPTRTSTKTPTRTPSRTPTRTPTRTTTRTQTPVPSRTPTNTATRTASPTASRSVTPTPTRTATPTPTPVSTGGPLVVADNANNRVLIYQPPFATGMNAGVVIGQGSFTSSSPAITQSGLNGPQGVAQDKNGNIFVADTSSSRVLEFKPPFSNGMNASVVIGQTNFTNSSVPVPPTQSSLNHAVGVALDGAGNLYVADFLNNRILQFKPPFSNGMNASAAIGQTSFTSTNTGAAANLFTGPAGIAFDGSGNLWVADLHNSRVLEFVPPFATNMSATVVLGQTDFTSSGFGTTQSTMNQPNAVAVDANGKVYVADSKNNRVLQFKPTFSNGMNATLVIGQPNFTTNSGSATQSTFNFPSGTGFDKAGDLFVGDNFSSRVMEFKPSFATGMNAAVVIGQTTFTATFAGTTQSTLALPTFVSGGGP